VKGIDTRSNSPGCSRDLRIDIHLAKVDTIGPEVFDAFYIRRENGSRIGSTACWRSWDDITHG
jgi:UTP:GlnB (protein PII) uridylyltransferase